MPSNNRPGEEQEVPGYSAPRENPSGIRTAACLMDALLLVLVALVEVVTTMTGRYVVAVVVPAAGLCLGLAALAAIVSGDRRRPSTIQPGEGGDSKTPHAAAEYDGGGGHPAKTAPGRAVARAGEPSSSRLRMARTASRTGDWIFVGCMSAGMPAGLGGMAAGRDSPLGQCLGAIQVASFVGLVAALVIFSGVVWWSRNVR